MFNSSPSRDFSFPLFAIELASMSTPEHLNFELHNLMSHSVTRLKSPLLGPCCTYLGWTPRKGSLGMACFHDLTHLEAGCSIREDVYGSPFLLEQGLFGDG